MLNWLVGECNNFFVFLGLVINASVLCLTIIIVFIIIILIIYCYPDTWKAS